MHSLTSPVGMIAGGGSVPREIAESLARRGISVRIITIDGEGGEAFDGFDVTRVNWGKIGRMVSVLKSAGCREMVIVGRVQRPNLLKVRPDAGLFAALSSIIRILTSGGDDQVLRGVVRYFEGQGFRVLGPADLAPELIVAAGLLGKKQATQDDQPDIKLGLDVVARLGPFDIGQAVVIGGGKVLAIEGAEGTDAMLARVKDLRAVEPIARGGVLIKRAKPGQELRVDMPAIGPATIEAVAAAGLAGVAVMAGQVIIAERKRVAALADTNELFVEGVKPEGASGLGRSEPVTSINIRSFSAASITARQWRDATRASRVVQTLQPFSAGHCAIVSGGRVFAVGGCETAEQVVTRFATYRKQRPPKFGNRGMAALNAAHPLSADIVERAAQAHLEGLVIVPAQGSVLDADVINVLRDEADAHNLLLFTANFSSKD